MIRNINRQKISENRQKWLKIGFTYPPGTPCRGGCKIHFNQYFNCVWDMVPYDEKTLF